MSEQEPRMQALKTLRKNVGGSLDFWELVTRDLDQSSLDILVGRSLSIPYIVNSSGIR